MAISIKTIPVLRGEAAERFLHETEENSIYPAPQLSAERKEVLHTFLDKSRDFRF